MEIAEAIPVFFSSMKLSNELKGHYSRHFTLSLAYLKGICNVLCWQKQAALFWNSYICSHQQD